MKKSIPSLSIVLCAALLAACLSVPAFSAPRYVTSLSAENTLEIVRVPASVDFTRMSGRGRIFALPRYDADAGSNRQVDLRSCDLSRLDVSDRLSDLLQADFDSSTIWPEKLPSGFDPRTIMELGKSPGPGFRTLHEIGVTGSGVGIAIIDDTLLVGHEEYADQLRLYEEIHYPENTRATMHGPAVASIAVGQNTGVAPGADLYFIVAPLGNSDDDGSFVYELAYLAQAIDRIVEINTMLPPERAIRVISISLGIIERMGDYEIAMQSIARAAEAGIYTVYVG